MKEIDKTIHDFSDRELLQFVVASVVRIEQKTKRMEEFLHSKYGDAFIDFTPDTSTPYDLRKTILEYHADAETSMESN